MNGLHADQGDRHAILHTNAVYVLKLSVIEMFKHYASFDIIFLPLKVFSFFFYQTVLPLPLFR